MFSKLTSVITQLKSRSAADGYEFWEHETRPRHRRDAADYYEEHAANLRVLFGKKPAETVLELCCGSGALYPYLGFDGANYTGVDFSNGMLGQFAKTHPGLNLRRADVATYADENRYDLILMEFAAQHFKLKQLAHVFRNVRSMMHSQSLFVCSTVPWKQARWDFYGKVLSPPYGVRRIPLLRLRVKVMLGIRDGIGSWFNPREINQIAAQAQLVPEYYGCLLLPYRFHVVLRATSSKAD